MKIVKYVGAIMTGLLVVIVAVYYFKVRLETPEPVEDSVRASISLEKKGPHFLKYGDSWLKKNNKGLWEMYLEGTPYALGMAFGTLARDLIGEKEAAFVGEIKNRIPSESYLFFLKLMVGWFNRDLDEYVPHDQLLEIYGASQTMADRFDFIAPKYQRALSYHAAHDIGHALQNMNLVGCTSFATWGDRSLGNKLLIGRNFDFYFGEDFARDKIVAFYHPDEGYQFMSVTWAGFSGVVSGINEKGLTVTLNAAKSAIPSKGKTPVSLIARQILQYAATIEEAYNIAGSYDSFVAETFLIGSKIDGKVGLIEKTPEKTALYFSDTNQLIATNHFQSEALKGEPLNQEYMEEGVSTYRYKRVGELMDSLAPLDPADAARILRDKRGLDNKKIGLGNEKAINQLIAHHAVIFSPGDMIAWVSSPPYQLGDFVAYDLEEIFSGENKKTFTYSDSLSLPPDPFLFTESFNQYRLFAKTRDRLQHFLYAGKGRPLTESEVDAFKKSNPGSFLTYYYLGDYFKKLGQWEKARDNFETGLNMEVAKSSERRHMEEGLAVCIRQLEINGGRDKEIVKN